MSNRESQWIEVAKAIRPHLAKLLGAKNAKTVAAALEKLLEEADAGKPVADRIKTLLESKPATAEWASNFLSGPKEKHRAERSVAEPPRPAPAPVAVPPEQYPGAVPPEQYAIVRVYFGTDRNKTGSAEPSHYYGGKRGEFSYGAVDVSIPHDHRMGALEGPKLWRFEFRQDPTKHVMLLKLEPLDRAGFLANVGAGVNASPNRDALLFIHGYNVSFDDAARRTAQIAYDLNFSGVPLLYSWPSEGAPLRYKVDENNVRWTVSHFEEFLELALTQINAHVVHVIAHSMGNRCLTEALRTFDRQSLGKGAAGLGQVIFAAPDIDSETFVDLAREFHRQAGRFTLYASSTDRALLASKAVNGYPRAGDAGPGLVIADGIDTVDATLVDTSLMGHSYIGQNGSILADVFDLLKDGRAPEHRFRLAARQRGGKRFWYFKA